MCLSSYIYSLVVRLLAAQVVLYDVNEAEQSVGQHQDVEEELQNGVPLIGHMKQPRMERLIESQINNKRRVFQKFGSEILDVEDAVKCVFHFFDL